MLRRRAVSNHRVDNWMHQITKSMWKGYPIYDWTTEDVWIAPEKLGWDYNETYDIMEMGGVPRGLQRLAPPFGEEPLQLLWIWAKCFPDVWDGMCARVPGAATAALYSRSELYSFRTRSEKPEELSWQDFLMAKLSQHEPAVRAAVARKLQEMIRRHYAKTSDPILVEAAHPASGISWNLLLFVADRGDLKNRRSGSALPVGPAYEAAKKRYTEELARCREHGQG